MGCLGTGRSHDFNWCVTCLTTRVFKGTAPKLFYLYNVASVFNFFFFSVHNWNKSVLKVIRDNYVKLSEYGSAYGSRDGMCFYPNQS